MIFNGAAGGERVEISANSGRVRFTRDLNNIAMDLDDVELDVQCAGRTRFHGRQRFDRDRSEDHRS